LGAAATAASEGRFRPVGRPSIFCQYFLSFFYLSLFYLSFFYLSFFLLNHRDSFHSNRSFNDSKAQSVPSQRRGGADGERLILI
jgi:hypothetical protein